MTNEEVKNLSLSLFRADTEEQLINILKRIGYWDDPKNWRYYGDREDNFSIIGNQQSRPEAALVEKIVNSVDAVLMNGCWLSGISPENDAAPKSVQDAVALYFMGEANKGDTLGRIRVWGDKKRTEVSKLITLAATGATALGTSANPCFIIADSGEGQTPNSMPNTLLSLDKHNKLRIQFVQGKFNMGGTGVCQFCGHNNLQFIISRRNPKIIGSAKHDTDEMWGFTIVRRENPPQGQKSSVYTYLAPIGADQNFRNGGILSFKADRFPIFPEGKNPYAREAEWGTAIKLYEYSATGFRTMMFRRDGLLSKLDILLPEIALPIRLYECRDYSGHPGSFETNLSGIMVRLEDNKAENLEDDFPTTCQFRALGEPMSAQIYAFRKGKVETYKKNEGIIFTVNGQTHGILAIDFFRRKNVGMGRIDDSILVIVDCSNISGRAREDLFMNSRDRLRNGELRSSIEHELEILIKEHPGLRALREKRKREELETKLNDLKPLRDTLKSILDSNPLLASLFATGDRLSNPLKTKEVADGEVPYKGKYHPSYFKFKDLLYGQELIRATAANMRSRVTFETDVQNDYFDRSQNQGSFCLNLMGEEGNRNVSTYSLNLLNGKATLSIELPDNSKVGDCISYESIVNDPTLIEPFINRMKITVSPIQHVTKGTITRGNPPINKEGNSRELPTGLDLPDIWEIHETDWLSRKHPFDKYSALEIVQDDAAETENSENGNAAQYSFYVNMDNIHYKTAAKASKQDVEILKAQWIYGLTLVGIALIQADAKKERVESTQIELADSGNEESLEDRVFTTTSAIASVLLPLIESLGSITEEQVTVSGYASIED
ncbi:MAG: hypothetical protein WC566_05220 [Dehalococcoidia bacterium]